MNLKKSMIVSLMFTIGSMAGSTEVFAASPEFSRSEMEWAMLRDDKMEYQELASLIQEYNLSVQNNQVLYNNQKNKSSQDIANSYREQADEIENSIVYGEDPMSLAAAKTAQTSVDRLRQQADENVEDSEIIKLRYDFAEATLVPVAQSSMISYHAKGLDLEEAKDQQEQSLAMYESTLTKQTLGMATEAEVLGAKEKLESTKASVLELEAERNSIRQKLCVMLGWEYNDMPEIGAIPAADFSQIDLMNPKADLQKALDQNYNLRVSKRSLENTTVVSSRDSLHLTIAQKEQSIATALETSYQNVLQAKTALDQAVFEETLEQRNMESIQRKYTLGEVSRREYEEQSKKMKAKTNQRRKADMSLFQAMETYQWAVNGLADS